jgi:hypothetical protein
MDGREHLDLLNACGADLAEASGTRTHLRGVLTAVDRDPDRCRARQRSRSSPVLLGLFLVMFTNRVWTG